MTNLRKILSHNLRLIRLSKGLSQEQLGDLCGLHRTYISDIECCTRNVAIDNIEKIAQALDIKPSDLLKEDLNENS